MTVLRTGAMLRVAFNRDEQRARVTAHPPFITRAAVRRVLAPLDPQGGGTWIAANSAGLVLALLNGERRQDQPAGHRPSRGSIIPALADCDSLEAVGCSTTSLRPA